MSDDPEAACAVTCVTFCIKLVGGICFELIGGVCLELIGGACLELIGGIYLDFVSTSKSPQAFVFHAPFDHPLQPIYTPAVLAHGCLAPGRTLKSKMQIRGNGSS